LVRVRLSNGLILADARLSASSHRGEHELEEQQQQDGDHDK
jgi:hypothetical protein